MVLSEHEGCCGVQGMGYAAGGLLGAERGEMNFGTAKTCPSLSGLPCGLTVSQDQTFQPIIIQLVLRLRVFMTLCGILFLPFY